MKNVIAMVALMSIFGNQFVLGADTEAGEIRIFRAIDQGSFDNFIKEYATINDPNYLMKKVGTGMQGRTLLTELAIYDFTPARRQIAEFLIAQGADVNKLDSAYGQNTPLTMAVFGDPRMVKFLLDHGANKNIRGGGNETALDRAMMGLATYAPQSSGYKKMQEMKVLLSPIPQPPPAPFPTAEPAGKAVQSGLLTDLENAYRTDAANINNKQGSKTKNSVLETIKKSMAAVPENMKKTLKEYNELYIRLRAGLEKDASLLGKQFAALKNLLPKK